MEMLWFLASHPYALAYATAAILFPGATLTVTAIAVRTSVALLAWSASAVRSIGNPTHANNNNVAHPT